MKAIYGLFPNPDSAQQMVDTLRLASQDLGFDAKRIVIASGEPYEGYAFSEEHAKSHLFALAAAGGLVGALAGYGVTSLTQTAYPLPTGGMPIVPAWTNGIIVYEMMMLGAILTTVVSLLVTARLPDFKTPITDPEVWEGKILVGVADPPEGIVAELGKRFLKAGAVTVKEFQGPPAR